jgi:hypothetical protein
MRNFQLKLISIFFLFLTSKAYAQIPDGYENGIIVTNSGDTLRVKIKSDREERMSASISYWDESANMAKKRNPRDTKYYRIGEDEYFSKTSAEGKPVFLHVEINGPARLYKHIYKEKKGNKSVRVEDYYVEKSNGGLKFVEKGGKFREQMATYFSDSRQLSQKISAKIYGPRDIETVVNEYNEWYKSGRPQNDDRFGVNNSNADRPVLVDAPVKDKTGLVGLDIPLFFSYNFVNYPTLLNQIYQSTALGPGFDVGVGVRLKVTRNLMFRAGINVRNKGFRATTTGNTIQVVNPGGSNIGYLRFNERSNLIYPGIYMQFQQEWKYFFLGSGFNLSFFSKNLSKNTIQVVDGGNNVLYQEENDDYGSSYLVNELLPQLNQQPQDTELKPKNFNVQFDVNVTVGGRFSIKDFIVLKPCIQYTIPFVPLYSGLLAQGGSGNLTSLNVSGYQFKVGLITDINFGRKK